MGTFYERISAYDPEQHVAAPIYFVTQYSAKKNPGFDDDDFQSSVAFAIDKAGLSMGDIADTIRVSLPTVRRWKEGRNLPHPVIRPVTVKTLAQMLAGEDKDLQAFLKDADTA